MQDFYQSLSVVLRNSNSTGRREHKGAVIYYNIVIPVIWVSQTVVTVWRKVSEMMS